MNCGTGQTFDPILNDCRPCFSNEDCYVDPFGGATSTATKPLKQLGSTALDILNEQLPNVVNVILGNRRSDNPNVPVTPVQPQRNDSTLIAIGSGVFILLLLIIILLIRVARGK